MIYVDDIYNMHMHRFSIHTCVYAYIIYIYISLYFKYYYESIRMKIYEKDTNVRTSISVYDMLILNDIKSIIFCFLHQSKTFTLCNG